MQLKICKKLKQNFKDCNNNLKICKIKLKVKNYNNKNKMGKNKKFTKYKQ